MQITKIIDQQAIQINEMMEPTDAYGMTIQILDTQIKYYNKLFLKHWEQDHSTERVSYEEKINTLKTEKSRILDLVKNANEGDKIIAVNCSFQLQAI